MLFLGIARYHKKNTQRASQPKFFPKFCKKRMNLKIEIRNFKMKDLDILKKSLMKMLSRKHQSKRPVSSQLLHLPAVETNEGHQTMWQGYSSNVESIHGAIHKLAKI